MLSISDQAPNFILKNQNGEEVSLDSFKGKKVVLYFYPRDNTPGCTTQACNLRDNIQSLEKHGIVVLGVSTDPVKSHLKFSEKFDLPFSILADENKEVVQAYGVWVKKNMYGKEYFGTARKTFLINENGTIDDIINKPKTKIHTEEILTKWGIK